MAMPARKTERTVEMESAEVPKSTIIFLVHTTWYTRERKLMTRTVSSSTAV